VAEDRERDGAGAVGSQASAENPVEHVVVLVWDVFSGLFGKANLAVGAIGEDRQRRFGPLAAALYPEN